METDRYERAARLFDEAMELPPQSRKQHVTGAAEGDDDLVARVHRMLAYAERASPTQAFVPAGAPAGVGVVAPQGAAVDARLIDAMIGRYRIARLVGEGGFGAVYQAEQERPVRRTVAIKILKSGMDSQRVIARFEAERQALALMEHPGIARVIDAGQTDPEYGSRPYFVMEFVSGEPITSYCDRKSLSLQSRLELFAMVCHAVQHAHHKGVIHRDLKPSNILVGEFDGDGGPMPKVIDFGIAKAIHQPLTDAMLVTNCMELLGTPQYMSPEQADADERAIDTRSDVYSLGVVLYELLTGTTPLDEQSLRSASYTRMVQVILEQRVERPSTRLSRLSAGAGLKGSMPAGRPIIDSRRLRGELDWIALKALDPERDRRYGGAAALAEDIRRYMNHEPVEAAPPSTAYRIRKFVRRHRVGVVATTLVALALFGGVVGTAIGMFRARESADQTFQINEFMTDMLTSVDPDRGKGADVRLVEVLKSASETASQRFGAHPELQAHVRSRLGLVYAKLSLFPQSAVEFKHALALFEATRGTDDPRTLECRVDYLRSLVFGGQFSEAQAESVGLADRIGRAFGHDHDLWFTVQQMHGQELSRQRKFVEAESFMQRLLQQAKAAGAHEEIQLGIMRGLVRVLWRQLERTHGPQREPIGAKLKPAARELAERSARSNGPTAMVALEDQVFVAQVLLELNDYQAAADMCTAMLNVSKERLGECHTVRKMAMDILSLSLLRLGNADRAAELVLQEIECARGYDPIILVTNLSSGIPILDRAGRWIEGEQMARELMQRLQEFGGGHGPMVLDAELAIARFVSLQGRTDEADQLFATLLPREAEASEDSHILARMHLFYGAHLMKRGLYEQAEQRMQAAVAALGDIREGTWNIIPDDVIVEFIALYQAWGKPAKVAEYQRLRHEALHPLEWTPTVGQ